MVVLLCGRTLSERVIGLLLSLAYFGVWGLSALQLADRLSIIVVIVIVLAFSSLGYIYRSMTLGGSFLLTAGTRLLTAELLLTVRLGVQAQIATVSSKTL